MQNRTNIAKNSAAPLPEDLLFVAAHCRICFGCDKPSDLIYVFKPWKIWQRAITGNPPIRPAGFFVAFARSARTIQP
jgi:hypothetical protein